MAEIRSPTSPVDTADVLVESPASDASSAPTLRMEGLGHSEEEEPTILVGSTTEATTEEPTILLRKACDEDGASRKARRVVPNLPPPRSIPSTLEPLPVEPFPLPTSRPVPARSAVLSDDEDGSMPQGSQPLAADEGDVQQQLLRLQNLRRKKNQREAKRKARKREEEKHQKQEKLKMKEETAKEEEPPDGHKVPAVEPHETKDNKSK